MANVEAIARKWGDSIAVILPRDVVKAENIRVNDRVHLAVKKRFDLSPFFGKWKTKKTAQELKDESREGWE
jgi:antitoxin component of MazEF toxin-antitoxin module